MTIATHGKTLRGLASLAVVLGVGCSGARTSVTQLWQAPAPVTAPMRSVIVFGARMDEASRRSLEDAFAVELAKRNIHAVRSYDVFPGTPPDQDKARAKVNELGLEGILVMSLKGVSERTTHVPSQAGSFWTAYYGPGWWGGPGYLVTDEVVTFESTLWDVRAEDKLVWAALSRTTNPSTGKSYIDSLVKTVVPKLEDARFFPPERD